MRTSWLVRPTLVAVFAFCLPRDCIGSAESDLQSAVTFYASFDEDVKGDYGGGKLSPSTRSDHSTEKGQYIIGPGFSRSAFRIAKRGGIHGGALQGFDVLPHRGRMFFPAKDNLAFKSGGWGGAVSFWINSDPNTMLKTPYCDPIQITEKRAADGGLWVDFPNTKPRDMRLGAFRGLAVGEKPVPESDKKSPLVRIEDVNFKRGDWHHIVMNCKNLDTGKRNAVVSLYVDGKRIGELAERDIAMKWNIERTGIYVAVNYIGLLDELAILDRPLTASEIRLLHDNPGIFATLMAKP